MPHDRKTIDALLTVAVNRMEHAALAIKSMRHMHREDCALQYWLIMMELWEDIGIGSHALSEAHKLMEADAQLRLGPGKAELPMPPTKGELSN